MTPLGNGAAICVYPKFIPFIKTSTGKTVHGATLESACAMLLAINDSQRPVGFKASGGIRTFAQAATYLNLAKHILGEDWPTPEHFRIGTSGLIGNLVFSY